jgi:hypothetical protein
MKLAVGGALFLAFLLVQRMRRGRPMPSAKELRNVVEKNTVTHDGMRFPHTCEACVPVAQYGRYDVYICNRDVWPVAVARYGPRAQDHVSNSDLKLPDENIRITFNRT